MFGFKKLSSNKTRLHQPKTKSIWECLSSSSPSLSHGAERSEAIMHILHILTSSSTPNQISNYGIFLRHILKALWCVLGRTAKKRYKFSLIQGWGRLCLYFFFLIFCISTCKKLSVFERRCYDLQASLFASTHKGTSTS